METALRLLGALLARLALPPRTRLLYLVVCLVVGAGMNALGHAWHIAAFRSWWQVLPVYLGYVFPLAAAIRGERRAVQLAVAFLAFAPLELVGYALGTSVRFPDNVLERALGAHNFTLAMVFVVSPIPLVINGIVRRLAAFVEVE